MADMRSVQLYVKESKPAKPNEANYEALTASPRGAKRDLLVESWIADPAENEPSTTDTLLTVFQDESLSETGTADASHTVGEIQTLAPRNQSRTLSRSTAASSPQEEVRDKSQLEYSSSQQKAQPESRSSSSSLFSKFRIPWLRKEPDVDDLSREGEIRRWIVKREQEALCASRVRVAVFVACLVASLMTVVFIKSGLRPARDDRQCKHSRHACEWEVISAVPVNVQQRPEFNAPILDSKVPGSIVVGRSENEAWLRLTGETGFMAFETGGSDILRQREDVWYEKVAHGSCADVGRRPIIDSRSCEVAALTLGIFPVKEELDDRLNAQIESSDNSAAPAAAVPWHDESRPEGCYLDMTGTLRINLQPGTLDDLGEAGDMQPICAMIPTTTATTSTTTTRSSTSTTTSTRGSHEEQSIIVHPRTTTSSTTSMSITITPMTTASMTTASTTISINSTTRSTITSTNTSTTSSSSTSPSAEPSLLCFSYMRPHTDEEKLVKEQLRRGAGIFLCDQTVVISSAEIHLGTTQYGEDIITWKNPPTSNAMGDLALPGVTTSSWLNSMTFQIAFNTILDDTVGRVWTTDFLVKVDPDAVLLPDRLRQHVRPHLGEEVYFLNCEFEGQAVLFGAIEVYSKQALRLYKESQDRCTTELEWQGWGEDLFFSRCMGLLGAHGVHDFTLVGDARCGYAPCFDHWRAAFHPFKEVDSWTHCWRQASGLADDEE